jgi:hypothetical protein
MAALPLTPFTLLLRADLEHPFPDSDPDVIAALNAYCALFTKVEKSVAARMDLLADLTWVRAHQIRSARCLAGGLCGSAPRPGSGAPPRLRPARRVEHVAHHDRAHGLILYHAGRHAGEAKGPDSSVDGQIPPSTARSGCLGPMMARRHPPLWERSSSPRQARSRGRTPRPPPARIAPRRLPRPRPKLWT